MCGASWVACGKNPLANTGDVRDASSIPTSGRSRGGGHGNPLQYSCLENSTVAGTWGLQSIGLQRVGYNWSDWVHVCRFSTPLLNRFYCVGFTQALPFQVMVFWYNFFFWLVNLSRHLASQFFFFFNFLFFFKRDISFHTLRFEPKLWNMQWQPPHCCVLLTYCYLSRNRHSRLLWTLWVQFASSRSSASFSSNLMCFNIRNQPLG